MRIFTFMRPLYNLTVIVFDTMLGRRAALSSTTGFYRQ
ncbi:hypothetical protein D1AOALGA4SA_2224 [Olavius algarvensis Delta 1 endosymbiont]|nr:hypothetical protein D1AOALGA4SA_2224 [Olavius algarvensis Delta 1 endosymbiont]